MSNFIPKVWMDQIAMNPDCRDGKHQSCSGDGWDMENDQPGRCPCACHEEVK